MRKLYTIFRSIFVPDIFIWSVTFVSTLPATFHLVGNSALMIIILHVEIPILVSWFPRQTRINNMEILHTECKQRSSKIALHRNLLKGLWFWTYVFLPCFHHVYDKLFLYEVQKFFFVSSLQFDFNNFLSRFEQVLF